MKHLRIQGWSLKFCCNIGGWISNCLVPYFAFSVFTRKAENFSLFLLILQFPLFRGWVSSSSKITRTTSFSMIHHHTECTMYKTVIKPTVLFGHIAWTMLEEHLQALRMFELRMLGTIIGGVQVNGVWLRKMNHEIARLYGNTSIQKVVKVGRVRRAGHVARLPRNNPTKMAFTSDPWKALSTPSKVAWSCATGSGKWGPKTKLLSGYTVCDM